MPRVHNHTYSRIGMPGLHLHNHLHIGIRGLQVLIESTAWIAQELRAGGLMHTQLFSVKINSTRLFNLADR